MNSKPKMSSEIADEIKDKVSTILYDLASDEEISLGSAKRLVGAFTDAVDEELKWDGGKEKPEEKDSKLEDRPEEECNSSIAEYFNREFKVTEADLVYVSAHVAADDELVAGICKANNISQDLLIKLATAFIRGIVNDLRDDGLLLQIRMEGIACSLMNILKGNDDE